MSLFLLMGHVSSLIFQLAKIWNSFPFFIKLDFIKYDLPWMLVVDGGIDGKIMSLPRNQM